jgi:hypothetical protein
LAVDEAQALRKMFREYAAGSGTLAQLAMGLNEKEFRTRNTKKLPGSDGLLVSGTRLFTTDLVTVILHKPFYTGLARHRESSTPDLMNPWSARRHLT